QGPRRVRPRHGHRHPLVRRPRGVAEGGGELPALHHAGRRRRLPGRPSGGGAHHLRGRAQGSRRMTRRMTRRWVLRAASVLAAAGLWQVLTAADVRLWLRFDRLPTLDEIAGEAVRQLATPVFALDLLQSLIRILTGFGLATIAGIVAGVALGRSARTRDVLLPLLEAVR